MPPRAATRYHILEYRCRWWRARMAGYGKVALVTAKALKSAGAWVNDSGYLGKRQRPDPLAEAGSDSPSP
jgi:hypothetical protein